ncbi:MAG TPA: RDD family protein [Bryobacteraceae bacterium]|nr:RDD family protein [Bryobacteraceae bacterium]
MSWYYAVNGQQEGPVEDAELQALAGAGTVTAATLVWRPGMEGWKAFGALAPASAAPAYYCQTCRKAWALEQMIPLRGVLICAVCKPVVLQKMREGLSPLRAASQFAGFWVRVIARMIDGTITSMASYVFQIPLFVVLAGADKKGAPDLPLLFGITALSILLSLAAAAFYECWFLVKKGATPGKMILGLKVVRAQGGAIGWKLAAGRFFAYMLGPFTIYIAYLMAAWDEEKRALHDRICDTRVVFGS